MHERGPLAREDIMLKICDLGNGCWTHHHFTNKIQTRQYRGPEVMLGIDYDTSSDLWSLACMVFELITGDFLFDPRKGQNYSKTDDHLAQMIEMLGPMPRDYAISGQFFDKFFRRDPLTNQFVFKNIDKLRHFPLQRLLTDKYRFKKNEADMLADFLSPMLKWYPSERPSAQKMLEHPWLSMPDEYDVKMSDFEYQKFNLRQVTQ
jgi:serine/threonine-protein kinase SRPK3